MAKTRPIFDSQQPIGNEKVVRHLAAIASRPLTNHAYLLTGPWGVGKTSMASQFARCLLCQSAINGQACGNCLSCVVIERGRHPDFIRLEGESESVGVDDVRRIVELLHRRPSVSARHVVMIDGVERLTESAANAFLKTLEEPYGETVMILTATSSDVLPATIVSRCSVLSVGLTPTESIANALIANGTATGLAKMIAGLSDGRAAYAQLLATASDVYEDAKTEVAEFLELFRQPLAERMMTFETQIESVSETRKSSRLFDRWESTLRRILRVTAGLSDRGVFTEQIQHIANRLRPADLQRIIDHFASTRRRIELAGNIRLNLDGFAVALPTLS